jgi:hypothetical protein
MTISFLNKKIEIKQFKRQFTLTILLDEDELITKLMLSLILLREGLANNLEIKFSNMIYHLSINHNQTDSICLIIDPNVRNFKGKIAMNALEYAIFYLLKYYRDGIAESEHIDLDFEQNDTIVTLTFKIKMYNEYSQDEINKLIGS